MHKLPAPLPIVGAPGVVTFDSVRKSPPNGLYVYEHLFYDTVTYLAAGHDAGILKAFGDTGRGVDDTLSNWPVGGRIDNAHKFHGLRLFASFLTEPTSGAAVPDGAGRMRDIDRVRNVARTVVDIDIPATGRRRQPIPLSFIPSAPSPRGVVIPAVAAAAAAGSQQFPQGVGNGDGYVFDLPLDGGEALKIALRTKAGAVAISADLLIQIAVYGWKYEPAG